MAITVDWPTKVINIPKADTQLVQASPTEIRQLDLNSFRLTLKDLEDDEYGMVSIRTHNHNAPVTVGGVTLARVVEIINGYTVTFEDGQYAVNLVGANSNIGDVVNVNQVSVRSANSAGLTYSKQAEDTAFGDSRVWIDTLNGLPGTEYPRGTTSDPVDNLADALSIISQRSLPKRLYLIGSLTVTTGTDISNFDIKGGSSRLSEITIQAGVNTTNLLLERLKMTGDLNGNATANRSVSFENIDDFDGKMDRCGIGGNIDLGSGGDRHDFIDCYSEVPGSNTPVMDCDGLSNLSLNVRRYSGGIKLENYNQPSNVSTFDLSVGKLILDSSCTEGYVLVRGLGQLVDNSGPNCTVNKDGLSDTDEQAVSQQILRGKTITNPSTGKYQVYDADDQVVLEADMYEDAAGGQAYRGQGAERRERLESP